MEFWIRWVFKFEAKAVNVNNSNIFGRIGFNFKSNKFCQTSRLFSEETKAFFNYLKLIWPCQSTISFLLCILTKCVHGVIISKWMTIVERKNWTKIGFYSCYHYTCSHFLSSSLITWCGKTLNHEKFREVLLVQGIMKASFTKNRFINKKSQTIQITFWIIYSWCSSIPCIDPAYSARTNH